MSHLWTSFWFILEYQELSFLLVVSRTCSVTGFLRLSQFHTMVSARPCFKNATLFQYPQLFVQTTSHFLTSYRMHLFGLMAICLHPQH